jgi:protein O-mannosyl-transferase
MSKRSKKKRSIQKGPAPAAVAARSNNLPGRQVSGLSQNEPSGRRIVLFTSAISLFLALVTFLVYWPSLYSDFVYDARFEILSEGFITSISNLPEVLSLKVLSTHVILGQRPGQLLYLMLIAAVSGKEPFGYHFCSNLMHAANVALFFFLLVRLATAEMQAWTDKTLFRMHLAAAAAAMIFAVHPLAVESVSEVSYSSSPLVAFFTLIALLAATTFRPEPIRAALFLGGLGVFCSFAATTCKESGIAVSLLLVVYWFLYRRTETRPAWILFLSTAVAVTALYLAARFYFAPDDDSHLNYVAGSLAGVFVYQPKVWVFMMGKLLWPVQLSADYTAHEVNGSGISITLGIIILFCVVMLQGLLAYRSRIGALGVFIYWLGLVAVSNFIPLHCPVADRYYYLSLAGFAMQIFALLFLLIKSRAGFVSAIAPILCAILPLTLLTRTRQDVFANSYAFWSDTLRVSPTSYQAHYNIAFEFHKQDKDQPALAELSRAIELNPNFAAAYRSRGLLKMHHDDPGGALADLNRAIQLDPHNALAYACRGYANYLVGDLQDALSDFRTGVNMPLPEADDYPHFFIWLVQMETAQQQTIANEELSNYLHRGSEKRDGWSYQVGRFLTGGLSEAEFLKAANDVNEKKNKTQHCEAYFYIGMKQVLLNDTASARLDLQISANTGNSDSLESTCARAWLRDHPAKTTGGNAPAVR